MPPLIRISAPILLSLPLLVSAQTVLPGLNAPDDPRYPPPAGPFKPAAGEANLRGGARLPMAAPGPGAEQPGVAAPSPFAMTTPRPFEPSAPGPTFTTRPSPPAQTRGLPAGNVGKPTASQGLEAVQSAADDLPRYPVSSFAYPGPLPSLDDSGTPRWPQQEVTPPAPLPAATEPDLRPWPQGFDPWRETASPTAIVTPGSDWANNARPPVPPTTAPSASYQNQVTAVGDAQPGRRDLAASFQGQPPAPAEHAYPYAGGGFDPTPMPVPMDSPWAPSPAANDEPFWAPEPQRRPVSRGFDGPRFGPSPEPAAPRYPEVPPPAPERAFRPTYEQNRYGPNVGAGAGPLPYAQGSQRYQPEPRFQEPSYPVAPYTESRFRAPYPDRQRPRFRPLEESTRP